MAEGNIIFRLQASVIMGLDGPISQIRCVGETVNFRVLFRESGGHLTPLASILTPLGNIKCVAPQNLRLSTFAPPPVQGF